MMKKKNEGTLIMVEPKDDVMHLRLTGNASHVVAYRDGSVAVVDYRPKKSVLSASDGSISGTISDTGTPFKLDTADEYVRAAVRQGIPIYNGEDPTRGHPMKGE